MTSHARRPAFPQPEPRQRIDARTPDAKEAGLRDIRRDMGGNIIGGSDETGKAVSFPGKPTVPAMPKAPAMPGMNATAGAFAPVKMGLGGDTAAATGGVPPVAAATNFPQPSGMRTGNPNVAFTGTGERATAMAASAAGGSRMPQAPAASPSVIPQQDGTTGGLITGKGTAKPQLLSMFGVGSASFPKPGTALPPGRIAEGGKDVTGDYAAGGKFSSMPKPLDGMARGPASLNANGNNEATAIPSPFPQPPRHSALLPVAEVRPRAEADALAASLEAQGAEKRKKTAAL